MLISGVVGGLLAGLIARGDFRRLAGLRPRWLPVFALGIVLRVVAGLSGGVDLRHALYVIALWLLVAFALVNLSLPGAAGIALGLTLNGLVITLNGGAMPVSADAAAAAGAALPTDSLHQALNANTVLPILSDVIPVPPLRNVYSLGDVSLALGVFVLIFRTMTKG